MANSATIYCTQPSLATPGLLYKHRGEDNGDVSTLCKQQWKVRSLELPMKAELSNDAQLSVTVGNDKLAPYEFAQYIATANNLQAEDGAFFVMHVDEVYKQMARWRSCLPRVTPFYAVKCNNDPLLLRLLASMGCGFDCASKNEIEQIVTGLSLPADRIIYANPCKTRNYIRHAATRGVNVMTFDNADELYKVKMAHPNAEMVLRIAVSDDSAQCALNIKFGCDPNDAAESLLKRAAELGVSVIGISFHIGSGARDASAWAQGIEHARRLFDVGRCFGHHMRLLDIGGGFVSVVDPNELLFEEAAATVNRALDQHFPIDTDVEIIAEPGRFFAATAFTLCCSVVAKTDVPASRITQQECDTNQLGRMYYINDGIYGSFNCILFDHQAVNAQCLFPANNNTTEFSVCSIWGPTCDGLDCVIKQTRLPLLHENDWVRFDNMGAYTICAASNFNGMPQPSVHYYGSAQQCARLEQQLESVRLEENALRSRSTSYESVNTASTSSDSDFSP